MILMAPVITTSKQIFKTTQIVVFTLFVVPPWMHGVVKFEEGRCQSHSGVKEKRSTNIFLSRRWGCGGNNGDWTSMESGNGCLHIIRQMRLFF